MKMLSFFAGAIFLLAITSGCTVSAPYGGAYAGVYGEYPSTYYNGYYSYPVYTYPTYHYWRGHYYHDYDHGYVRHYNGGHHGHEEHEEHH